MTENPATEEFGSRFRGSLISPKDPDYEEARTIYNAMIDKRPRLIARCVNIGDVLAAVEFGQDQGLSTSIRGGGHNGPGLALVEDGLVIDLSPMTGVRVDPERKTVRVEPGCTWGEVDHATHPFGLAAVSGIISTTGVGGLTLGGGHGYLTRKYGLTIDNLLRADVVLADGRLVHASETENSDLFWALRGGGGNFGIITSFEFQLHPVAEVIAGPLFWPYEELESSLKWYRDWLPEQSHDIYAFYLVAEVPSAPPFPEKIHGRKVCGLMWCCLGPPSEAQDKVQEARHVAKPLFEHVGPMPFPALQSLFDGLYPPGHQWYWKGDFIKEIPDEAVAMHVKHGEVPTPLSTMHLYPVDGEVQERPVNSTAWAHRDANWSMVIAGVDPSPSNTTRIEKWARSYWESLHPYSAGASYINFMMDEGDERIQATYGANYERLRKIKAKYDPENFFHVNQNIAPAS